MFKARHMGFNRAEVELEELLAAAGCLPPGSGTSV
jgi:hypothetical protein